MSQLKVNLTPQSTRACILALEHRYAVTHKAYLSNDTLNPAEFSPDTAYYIVSGLTDWTNFTQDLLEQSPELIIEQI